MKNINTNGNLIRILTSESRVRKSLTVYEGWTINQIALELEKKSPSNWKFRGIEIQWESLEKEYKKVGLPPGLPGMAWRTSTPLYFKNKQVGYATSGCWSPILKCYIALAHIHVDYADINSCLDFEIKVEHFRKLTPAIVVETPFYNPKRKISCPN